jgi:tetratricopeptide (TPR) repeat protein
MPNDFKFLPTKTMKATAPWIIAILLLALSPLEVFGRITNRQPASGGGASRNPVTNSRVSRPAQQPAVQRPAQRPSVQRPAQQPAQRPSVQRPSVQRPANPPSVQRPAQRPSVQRPANPPSVQRPAQLPAQRPSVQRPAERPGNRPITRPETLPNIRPESRPVIRPNERPATLPGNVTFPRPNDRPNVSRPDISRPGGGTNFPGITRPGGAVPLPEGITRPGGGINRPEINRPGGIARPDNTLPDISRPGGGLTRPGGITRPDFDLGNRPGNRPEWGNDWGNWGNWNRPGNRPGNRPNFNNNNININNNMWNSPSWNYRPNYWGSRPWWSSRHHHHWHHGSWCHGWNSSCRRRGFVNGFVWGVTAWSMGNWIFNSGYQNFHNPFPAPPVVNSAGTTIINYTSPITVVAAGFPPGDEASELAASEKAQSAMETAREAFKKGDFDTSLKAVDSAISVIPGDPVMHEFRALVFFAMGRFNDAAGVLNPILASGPGWDWTTMTGLFNSQDDYVILLRKLEDHHKANPDSAAANFLLGYHYLVLGHLEQALELFEHSAKLEPTDTVSAGLRDLLRDSITSDDEQAEEAPPPVPVNPDKLVGTWVSKVADDGTITLVMTKEGDFTWSFDKTENSGKLSGEFGIYDSNLLVLMSEDSQMVGEVTFAEDSKLSFVLAGGPRGDPGLTFVRKP